MSKPEKDLIVAIRNDIRAALAHAAREVGAAKMGEDEYERYAVLMNRLIKDEITIDQFEDRLFEALSRRDNPYAAELARLTTNKVGRVLNRYRSVSTPRGEIEELKMAIEDIKQRLDEVK